MRFKGLNGTFNLACNLLYSTTVPGIESGFSGGTIVPTVKWSILSGANLS